MINHEKTVIDLRLAPYVLVIEQDQGGIVTFCVVVRQGTGDTTVGRFGSLAEARWHAVQVKEYFETLVFHAVRNPIQSV